METQYHKVAAYPMKIRLYPTKEQAQKIDGWLLGLQKAYNMTLYALREGVPELRRKSKDGITEFPDWTYIQKSAWLDKLRERSNYVAGVPGGALSSSAGGALNADIRKAWESQGKLPVDAWFKATDKKGRPIVRWYSERNPRTSCYLQIEARKFTRNNKSVYITLQKDFTVKARGWNDHIRFEPDSDESFFEKYKDSEKKISFRVCKDCCGDYYGVLTLKDVYRPVKAEAERGNLGIDAGISAMATDSDGVAYENPHFKKNCEDLKAELNRQLARRYGAKNEQFRKERAEVRRYNTLHREEIQEKTLEAKKIEPSKRYLKAQTKLSLLERKVARLRDMRQHIYSAQIAAKAKFVAIENLNVDGMMKNSNLADSLSDAAMSEFLRKIKYKVQWTGGEYHAIGTFTASTERCSQCGYTLQGDARLTLGDRTFCCPACGYTADRDANAAKSILKVALEEVEAGIPSADTIKKPKEKKKRTYPDKPIGKQYPNFFTHFSEELAQQHKNPFVIVDEHQIVVDDSQGHGFTNRQSAQKYWIHKMKNQKQQQNVITAT